MATILITGGTGLIGQYLSKQLLDRGYSVMLLCRSRQPNANPPAYAWNIEEQTIDKEAIATADYIIHLAGENIGDKRWTSPRKQAIIDSRVKTAQLLYNKVKEHSNHLKTFISASAIGYYGTNTVDTIYKESDAPANDFLGKTCQLWEEAAEQFQTLGIRTVKIRTGVVLTSHGGALEKMTAPVKLGIGSAIGNGRQYMPWIHIDDLCGIYIKAIEDAEIQGAYNAVAPEHVTNKEFTCTLAHVLNKPFLFPDVPAFSLKILFGEMATILLKGSRVTSDKIQAAGYIFRFPTLKNALTNLLCGE